MGFLRAPTLCLPEGTDWKCVGVPSAYAPHRWRPKALEWCIQIDTSEDAHRPRVLADKYHPTHPGSTYRLAPDDQFCASSNLIIPHDSSSCFPHSLSRLIHILPPSFPDGSRTGCKKTPTATRCCREARWWWADLPVSIMGNTIMGMMAGPNRTANN